MSYVEITSAELRESSSYCIAFSPSDLLMASGGYEDFSLWKLPECKRIWTSNPFLRYVNDVAFSPDGRFVVAVGPRIDHGWAIQICSLHEHKVTNITHINVWSPESVAFGPVDSTVAAAVGAYPSVNLFEISIPEKTLLPKWKEHKLGGGVMSDTVVRGIDYRHDGKYIAARTHNKIYLLNAKDGKTECVASAPSADNTESCVSFCYGGHRIAAAGDNQLILWMIKEGGFLRSSSLELVWTKNINGVSSFAINEDDSWIAVGGKVLKAYSMPDFLEEFSYIPDGRVIGVAASRKLYQSGFYAEYLGISLLNGSDFGALRRWSQVWIRS